MATLLFLLISAIGYFVGPNLIHKIAVNFHENRITNSSQEFDYDVALKEMKALQWIEPDNTETSLRMAEMYLVTENWLEAEHILTKINNPEMGKRFEFCRLMAFLGAFTSKVDSNDWVKRAIASSDHNDIEILLLRANVLRFSNDRRGALDLYWEILHAHPGHKEAMYFLSELHTNLYEVKKNRKGLNIASETYRYSPEFLAIEAQANRRMVSFSRIPMEDLLRTVPRMEALGMAYIDIGHWDDAIVIFKAMSTLELGTWRPYYWLHVDAVTNSGTDAASQYLNVAKAKGIPAIKLRSSSN